MLSRNSRATNAPLDPYGIYGTRTQARMRASRRRRQSQNLLLIFVVLATVLSVFALSRWRRGKIDVAPMQIETGAAIGMAPIFAPPTKSKPAALLIANRDGVLLRYDKIENPDNDNAASAAQKTILLRDDFPIHAPLLAGDKLFVPSESGVLTALLWREKKVLWRRKFDDSLTARPATFSIARPAPKVAVPPTAISPTVASVAATNGVIVPVPKPVPAPPKPAPLSSSRQVVVAASDAGLVMAIDAVSGQLLWRARMPAPIGNGLTAVEANGRARILVPLLGGTAMRGGVWCLDGASGKVLWRFPQDARSEAIQFAAPLADLTGNRAYFGNDLGAIFALNLTTGTYDVKKKIGWKNFVSQGDENSKNAVLLRATPILISATNKENAEGGTLIFGDGDGVVWACSLANGSTLWRASVAAPIISLSRVPANGEPQRVLIVTRSSQILILDAQTGKTTRRLSGRNEIFVGADVSDSFIFAATENGAIHRFALNN